MSRRFCVVSAGAASRSGGAGRRALWNSSVPVAGIERGAVADIVEHRLHGGARALALVLAAMRRTSCSTMSVRSQMHGEDTAAGQRPVGHLDDAAGDRAPPLGRLAGQVEALDTAGDPALQSAGQRLDRPVVAAQRAIAHDVPEGRQGFQQLVRHVRAGGPSRGSGRPSARRLRRAARRRSCCRAWYASCPGRRRRRGAPGQGSATGRRRRDRGRSAARALALDVGEQADDGHEAQHDGGPARYRRGRHGR